MRLLSTLALTLALTVPAASQIIPKDAADPVEVRKGKGTFAGKLQGVKMPTGKGWKPVSDPQKLFQVMVPEGWKADLSEAGLVKVTPPGAEAGGAGLLIALAVPRDADPLEIDETFALNYADSLAEDPSLKRLKFEPTDSGLVVARGLKFALAGGKLSQPKAGAFQQQQLVYISEDRIVTMQFTSKAQDWEKYSDDVAKIFASYYTLGVRKIAEDE